MTQTTHRRRIHGAEWPLWLAYAALATYFTAPVLVTGASLGIEDWDPMLFLHAAVLKSAVEYGQPPWWNPWYCGGNVLWQNPQVPILTPFHPMAVVLGIAPAMKLNILLHYLVGFAGMHVLLTRGLEMRSRAWLVFLAASVTLAGNAALHLAVGHTTFLPFFYLPWFLHFAIRAAATDEWRWGVGTAAVAALAVWNGGLHVAVMSGMALACFLVSAAVTQRRARPLLVLAVVGLLTALFAAPRIVPTLAFLREPDMVDIRFFPPAPDRLTQTMLAHSFLNPFQYRRMTFGGQNYGWHEYGNYLGPLAPLLIVAGAVWLVSTRPVLHRQHWLGGSLAITCVALLLLALGEVSPAAPYVLLRRLPVLSEFRVPSRYLLVFTPVAVAMVACVVRRTGADAAAPPLRRWIVMTLVLATAFLAYQNRMLLVGAFPYAPLGGELAWMSRPPAPGIDVETDGFAHDSPMLRALGENRAVLRCNEPLQRPGAVDPAKPVVFGEDGVRVSHVAFSPNRIEFRAIAGAQGGGVVINQRYATGWTADRGELTTHPRMQLPVLQLPPDAVGSFVVSFFPPGLLTGVVLWVVGIGVAAVLWRRPARGPANNVPTAVVPSS